MKVLVVGDDGYAHALVWKLVNSPQSVDLVCAPGNGGTSQLVPRLRMSDEQRDSLMLWAFEQGIDLLIPTSTRALVGGIVDEAVRLQRGIIGPPRAAARLMRSRCATRELLARHSLPTLPGQAFTRADHAERYLAAHPLPVMLCPDNPDIPARVYEDRYAALTALRQMLGTQALSGDANGVVIEQYVAGKPFVFSVLTDGQTTLPLLPVQTVALDETNERGERVADVGAFTSASKYSRRLQRYLTTHIMQPLLAALQHEDLPYWGFLGIDGIITSSGPLVTGLRCNLTPLEAQVVLPRLQTDLLTLLHATIARRLEHLPPLAWADTATVGIVLYTAGYPHHFPIGSAIAGLTDLDPDILVFHHETGNPLALETHPPPERSLNTRARELLMGAVGGGTDLVTTGGHVLTLVASGATLQGARGRAIINAERVRFVGATFRDDIAARDLR